MKKRDYKDWDSKPREKVNLAKESDDTHMTRMYIHFHMQRFVEYISRFAILVLIAIDIVCDHFKIGQRLLTQDNGIINESNCIFLILLCVISLIEIFLSNICSIYLLSRNRSIWEDLPLNIKRLLEDHTNWAKLDILTWIIFGDEYLIFKRYWIFFR